MLQHADSRLLNAYPFPGAKSAIAAVNLSQLLVSSAQQSPPCAAQSPLNSEGSSTISNSSHKNTTTTTTTTIKSSSNNNNNNSSSSSTNNLECSTSIQAPEDQICVQSSDWSEFLNGAACNPFMGDSLDNTIPTSSTATWSWSGGGRDQEPLSVPQWNQAAAGQALPDLEGGDWSPGQLGCLPTAPEVSEHHLAMEHSDFSSTMSTAMVDPDQISANPMPWTSILMGSAANEDTSLDNDAFFSNMKLLNKSVAEPWSEFSPMKSSAQAGFHDTIDDMMKQQQQQQQQFSLSGHHLSSMDTSGGWSRAAAVTSNLDATFSGSSQFGPMRSKIKQEMDVQYFQQQQQQQTMLPPPPTVSNNVLMNEVPSPSRWGAHSSRLPAMLSQVLPSSTSGCKRGGAANLFGSGSSNSRSFGNYVSPKAEPYSSSSTGGKIQNAQREQSCSMSQHSSGITSQHSYDSKDSHASKHLMDENREVSSSDPVKRGASSSNDHSDQTFFKRPRIEQQQASPTLPFKATTFVLQVRKEKLGERITALQQLVAPFGKTDTASVLLEAIGYIKFLHEQVQVLSTPYMKNAAVAAGAAPGRPNVEVKGSSAWAMSSSSDQSNKSRDSDEPRQDLRSRGLCLVPISCTLQVANDNGADYYIGGSAGGASAAGSGGGGGGGTGSGSANK